MTALRTAKGVTHLLESYQRKGHNTDVAVTACGAWLFMTIITEAPLDSINDLGACRACYKIAKEHNGLTHAPATQARRLD